MKNKKRNVILLLLLVIIIFFLLNYQHPDKQSLERLIGKLPENKIESYYHSGGIDPLILWKVSIKNKLDLDRISDFLYDTYQAVDTLNFYPKVNSEIGVVMQVDPIRYMHAHQALNDLCNSFQISDEEMQNIKAHFFSNGYKTKCLLINNKDQIIYIQYTDI